MRKNKKIKYVAYTSQRTLVSLLAWLALMGRNFMVGSFLSIKSFMSSIFISVKSTIPY